MRPRLNAAKEAFKSGVKGAFSAANLASMIPDVVLAIADNRWRAYIVRIPGVPTALMPFYGSTPVEAAQLLCDWLARAHARAANHSPAV